MSVDLHDAKITLARIEHSLDKTVGHRVLTTDSHRNLSALHDATRHLRYRLDHAAGFAAAVDWRVGKNPFLSRNTFTVPLL